MSDSAVPPFAITAALLDPATPPYFDRALDTWNVFRYADVARGSGADPGRGRGVPPVGHPRGVHYCLGAELGRLEMRILTERLLTRVPPEIELDPQRPASRSFGLLHGVAEATLIWSRARR